MKRFYTAVTVEPHSDGFGVCLDGRPVLTKAKHGLVVPNETLAQAVVLEWEAQEDTIKPDTMPLTQIISTRLDKVTVEREAMYVQILRYIDTDLLFYRTDMPEAVGEVQAESWDPVIKAAEDRFGVDLRVTTDLIALVQSSQVHDAFSTYISGLNDDEFTVLQLVTPLAGSVICGMLFVDGKLAPDDIMDIARVEERYKDAIYDAEKYGPDPAMEKVDKAMMLDLEASAQYLELLSAK